jgi:peptidoglycan/LPS O-acetylase OafA/YrhL
MTGHLPRLDGIRGVAILAVMVFHFSFFEEAVKADDAWHLLSGAGWMGVDLFFVLSGFLITGILVDSVESERYFRTFYARRVLRILPLYYGFVILRFHLAPLLVPHQRTPVLEAALPWYWTYTQNFLYARGGFAAAPFGTSRFWSLAVEEQFYIVWPFVVWLLRRRTLMWVCVGMIVASIAVRLAMLADGASLVAVSVVTPACLDGLAVGAFIALAMREEGGIGGLVRPSRYLAILAAAILLGVAIVDRGFDQHQPAMLAAGMTPIALLGGAVLVGTLVAPVGSRLVRVFDSRVLRAFGKYSYGLYVLHNLAPTALSAIGLRPAMIPVVAGSIVPRVLVTNAVDIAVACALALLSWNLWEKHFLKLKALVPNRRPVTVVT